MEDLKTIRKSKLKQSSLFKTGRQVYGLDEYIYIKNPVMDKDKAIISFYCFLDNNYNEYIIVPSEMNKNNLFIYEIKDNIAFVDSNGYYVYGEDEWGDITKDIFRDKDFSSLKSLEGNTRNYIVKHIKEWMGYHKNEGGTIDMLDMFGDDKIKI